MSDLSARSVLSDLSFLSVTCPGCPVCPDDHNDHDDHYDHDDHDDHIEYDDPRICKEVGGCTQGSWRLSDQMRIAASIAQIDNHYSLS